MNIRYSKPSADVKQELLQTITKEKELHQLKESITKQLAGRPEREVCILCGQRLKGETFNHREIVFIFCDECDHMQTALIPPKGYPHDTPVCWKFNQVYSKLNYVEYNSRKKRIYAPKLEWIWSSLTSIGYTEKEIKDLKWVEIGAGAGYFLSALKDKGVTQIVGLETDEKLITYSSEFIDNDINLFWDKSVIEAIEEFKADVYAAFFVFEHLESINDLIIKFRGLPKGTILCFSVPVFGFSALLDNIFTRYYVRNLDAVVHTQVFTEESIDYFLKSSGLRCIAKWLFGQDISDIYRIFTVALGENIENCHVNKLMEKFGKIQDSLQSCLDNTHICDQQHILAIKD